MDFAQLPHAPDDDDWVKLLNIDSVAGDLAPGSGNGPLLETEWAVPPKVGARFSSRASRVLKTWLAENIHHPYPTVSDIELIQVQTGLTRQQVITWFRNARRNRKAQVTRPTTPIPRHIQYNSTPKLDEQSLPFQQMDPLQRWQNSPPEHEPAAASAIAQAVSGFDSSHGNTAVVADAPFAGSWRDDSSASSAGTSQFSNSSLGSAWSSDSRLSPGVLDHRAKLTKRRRRRPAAFRTELQGHTPLNPVCHPFQCTFCTETFITKHNWHRHEKSLHLSLERWECSPEGPTIMGSGGELTCTFCGQTNPDHRHLLEHNYAACQERFPEERVFYRKDHLQQHLRVVHETRFTKHPMEGWRREMENVRSRCGFCDIQMDTWAYRVDHLADHFKQGKSMADWKGTWGFESHVLDMVENSMPPCMPRCSRLPHLFFCLDANSNLL